MSPLISAPNRGYADYQRVSNYDTDLLFSGSVSVSNATVASGIFDVSRFAYVGGTGLETTAQSRILFNWFWDDAGAQTAGTRTLMLDVNITSRMIFRIPNQGPFVRITMQAIGLNVRSQQVNAYATNRVQALEHLPSNYVVVDLQLSVLPNGGLTIYPTDYAAGPARIFFHPQIANCQWSLQALQSGGTYDTIDQIAALPSANPNYRDTLVLPPGAWRLLTTNPGAASTIIVAITLSDTGAT